MDKYYILEGRDVVECSLDEWGRYFEKSDRVIKQENFGEARISTVFLGIDHNFGHRGKPLLFETMVFGGRHDGDQQRYSTYDEAEAGHKYMVALEVACG